MNEFKYCKSCGQSVHKSEIFADGTCRYCPETTVGKEGTYEMLRNTNRRVAMYQRN